MVRFCNSAYRSRASVWVSADVPSWEESVISANPLWFGRFQKHRPCRQQPCQRISWLPRSRSDYSINRQINLDMKLTDKPLWITIQYICVLFLTVCFSGLLVTDLFVWYIAIFFWLFIPAVIVACISFICSLRCNSRHKKILLILNGANILLVSFLFFNPSNRCDADIMEKHYKEYGGRMEQIYRNLYNKMTSGCSVEIEFEHGDVSIFHFSNGNGEMDSNWDPSEEKIDSLLIQSGLDRNSLIWLQKELDEIGCISISMQTVPDAPFCIGFRRIGMGKYDYQIYHRPLSSEEQKKINESDASIVYSPFVVFEYGGGAIGSQNFVGKDEYLKKKKQFNYETDR